MDCGVSDPTEECIALDCGTWTNCACEKGCEKCCGTGVLGHEVCEVHRPTRCYGKQYDGPPEEDIKW